MKKNGKIGTYNGIDFYNSLDAMLKDGKELDKSDNFLGKISAPNMYGDAFTDDTGLVENLKEEIVKVEKKCFERISEFINKEAKKCDKHYSITAFSDNLPVGITALYGNGTVITTNKLDQIKNGYLTARGV